MCVIDKPELARQVLAYLAENVEAQDTFEGIVEWWLLEQRIKSQTARIREVLDELAVRRLIVGRRARDSRIHYRINRGKLKEVQELLARSDGG
jgi:hypothetical protein